MKSADGLDRFGRPYTEDRSTSKSLVRIQKYIDDDIPGNLAELASRIENVRKILSQARENVDLYSRSWTTAAASSSLSSCSEGIDDHDGTGSVSQITVAQFNTLAKGLSSGLNNLFPTPFESENDGSYGGFTELPMPDVILDFDRIRKWRLLEVIIGGGTSRKKDVCIPNNEEEKIKAAFDILALEEVDEYYSFFEPILTKFTNYCGVYQPKQYSPCVRFGWYSDGVALLWNQEKFQVIPKHGKDDDSTDIWVEKGSYEGGLEYQNQVYIIVPLQIKGTDNCIIVAVTHLKAKKGVTKGIPNEKIRETQASEIRHRLEQMADQLKAMGWKDVSILILGDFNSEPDSASVKTILEESGDWKFQSAYTYDDNSYTTWKTRKDGTTRRVIDYIFHAGAGVECKQVLSIPNNEELEKTFLPGLRYPSDHLLIAAKFQLANENGQIDQIPEASNSPFEWLTNFQSLRHLLLPSSIVFASPPPSVGNASSERSLKLNSLHVGCGTSTVAESLLCLREKNIHDRYCLQYGYVVNVDVDQDALSVMQRRWRQRQLQTQKLDDMTIGTIGTMEWKYLDFKCEESCRSALDPVYRDLLQATSANAQNDLGGGFDLVLDKSTLDCLLCSETDVVAGFLCEVYRALRAPTFDSNESDATESNEVSSGEVGLMQGWWGGVYVLVTFHPIEFIHQLLAELPGANWQIEYEVIRRKADIVDTIDALEVDEVVANNSHSEDDAEEICHLPPVSSAWASGSFNPDESYRKTITVFTCRRSYKDNQSYTLDRQAVREHIESICDQWYQTTSPMVTEERETKLRFDFESAAASQVKGADSSTPVSLDLKTCYELLFTADEKQVLTYDYFIEDWEAYCKNMNRVDRRSMTIDTALDFLKEMQ